MRIITESEVGCSGSHLQVKIDGEDVTKESIEALIAKKVEEAIVDSYETGYLSGKKSDPDDDLIVVADRVTDEISRLKDKYLI